MAEWPPARLDVWLDMVREADFDKQRLFDCVETVWLDWEEVDRLDESFGGDSMNSSRIGLNLSAMKEKLLLAVHGSPQRSSPTMVIKSALKESVGSEQKRAKMRLMRQEEEEVSGNNINFLTNGVKKMLTYEEENNLNNTHNNINNVVADEKDSVSKQRVLGSANGQRSGVDRKDRRRECIAVELKDLQQGTHRLKKLIVNGGTVEEVQKKALSRACQEIERQLAVIKGVLDRGGSGSENTGGDLMGDVVKTPKSVRFCLD